jgi:hypothetical protein
VKQIGPDKLLIQIKGIGRAAAVWGRAAA